MQEPAKIAGFGISAVPATEKPEPAALLVFHSPVITNRQHFAIALPPLTSNALRPVGTTYPVPHASPGKGGGRMVG